MARLRAALLTASVGALALIAAEHSVSPQLRGRPWARHTIDRSSQGADGVRLIDVNTDGRPDVVTGWEQGGVVRIYFNPSRVDSRGEWRQVTVGRVGSPEDAVFADLDNDGAFDVISSCEGRTNSMFFHWAPRDPDRYWDASAWTTEPINATRNRMRWMFAAPMQVDGKHGLDIIAGGKDEAAAIGWLEAPASPRSAPEWKWHALRPVGWVMSIVTSDMDGDGDLDILASDRKGSRSGVFWLENPGRASNQTAPWVEHTVGSQGREVMFVDVADLDGDGLRDVLTVVKPREIQVHRRKGANGREWETSTIAVPAVTGFAKAVRAADVDLDGKLDLVFTAESATGDLPGIIYLAATDRGWEPRDIGGAEGEKYDLVEMIDLDGDGDLDALTTEESDGLGVVWYENPSAR